MNTNSFGVAAQLRPFINKGYNLLDYYFGKALLNGSKIGSELFFEGLHWMAESRITSSFIEDNETGSILFLGTGLIGSDSQEQYSLCSKDFPDRHIPALRLTKIFIEIRECKKLCLERRDITFNGLDRGFHVYDVLGRIEKEKPVEKQKLLMEQMREVVKNYDDELVRRCSYYADKVTDWKWYQ